MKLRPFSRCESASNCGCVVCIFTYVRTAVVGRIHAHHVCIEALSDEVMLSVMLSWLRFTVALKKEMALEFSATRASVGDSVSIPSKST